MASVLFVDDNPTLCRAMSLLLRMQGHRSDTAASVEEALSRLQQDHYDIVISDLCMPGQDGIDLLKMVRSHPSAELADLPVVILSAVDDSRQIQQARAAGADDYLVKAGTNFAKLPERIMAYLHRRGGSDQRRSGPSAANSRAAPESAEEEDEPRYGQCPIRGPRHTNDPGLGNAQAHVYHANRSLDPGFRSDRHWTS